MSSVAETITLYRARTDLAEAMKSVREFSASMRELVYEKQKESAGDDEYKLKKLELKRSLDESKNSVAILKDELAKLEEQKKANAAAIEPLQQRLTDLGKMFSLGGILGMGVAAAAKAFDGLGETMKKDVTHLIEMSKAGERWGQSSAAYKDSLDAMFSATKGLISAEELLRDRRRLAFSDLKISEEQYVALSQAAVKLAKIEGTDGTVAMDKLTDAIVHGNVRALRALGVEVTATNDLEAKKIEILKQLTTVGQKYSVEVQTLSQRETSLAERRKKAELDQFELLSKHEGVIGKVYHFWLDREQATLEAIEKSNKALRERTRYAGKSIGEIAAMVGEAPLHKTTAADQEDMRRKAAQHEEAMLAVERAPKSARSPGGPRSGEDPGEAYKALAQRRYADSEKLLERHYESMSRATEIGEQRLERDRDQAATAEIKENARHQLATEKLRDASYRAQENELRGHYRIEANLLRDKLEADKRGIGLAYSAQVQEANKAYQLHEAQLRSQHNAGLLRDAEYKRKLLEAERKHHDAIRKLDTTAHRDLLRADQQYNRSVLANRIAEEQATRQAAAAKAQASAQEVVAIGQTIAANIVAANSAEDFAKRSAAAMLNGIASMAWGQMAKEVALGLGAQGLTWGVPNPSSLAHFASAAMWGVLGGGLQVGAGYLGSGGGGGGSASGGAGSGGGGWAGSVGGSSGGGPGGEARAQQSKVDVKLILPSEVIISRKLKRQLIARAVEGR